MGDLQADLDAFMSGEAADVDEDARWPPLRSVDEANRLLRSIARREHERDEVDALYDAEMRRLIEWRDDRRSGIDRELDRLRGTLEAFMRAQERLTGSASLDLPNGVLRLRAAPPRLIVTDEETFMAWASGDRTTWERFVRVKQEVDKVELKKLPRVEVDTDAEDVVTSDLVYEGERIPGVELVEPKDPIFTATTTREQEEQQ